jgi:hypothetical protein
MLNKVLNFAGTDLTVYSNGWSWGASSVTSTVENLIITTSPISSIADYEPYVGGTASPNPDYPQEVQTVTGRQVVTITDGGSESQEYEINLGKNLFDKDNANIFVGYFYDGSPVLTPQSGNANNYVFYVPCEPNTAYSFRLPTASANPPLGTKNIGTTSVLPAAGVSVSGVTADISRDTATYENYITASDAKYLVVRIQGSSFAQGGGGLELTLANLQIEKGSTATTYAPYFTPIELCKIGTYQDYIYKSGEDWYLKKNIGGYTITGSEPVSIYNSNVADLTDLFNSSPFVAQGGGVCNRASYNPVQPGVSTTITLGEFALQKSGNTYNFFLKLPDSSYTESTAQQWFASNQTKVYYPLATPTDTQITDATLIAQLNALNAGDTYDGTTIITVSSENLASTLEVVVEADSKLAPDSVYGAAIKDGAVSVDKIADLKALADALAPYLNS